RPPPPRRRLSSPWPLADDLADLDLRLDIRVIRHVRHDLLTVLPHPLLKLLDLTEVDVPDGDIRRRGAWRAARLALVHLGANQTEAGQALADQLHVLVDVVVMVELFARLVGVQH